MKPKEIQKILQNTESVKIAVIGDFCLDSYWFVDESGSEISVETGLATRTVRNQRYSLGGAGNVTNNLAAMGVKNIQAFGVVGSDPFYGEMVKLMQKANINTDHILVQKENWSTHVYIKPYVGDDEQNRIDFGNFNELSEETADQLIQNLKNEIPEIDLIIINEQVLSGIHTPYFRKKIIEMIGLFPDKIFICDSRHYSGEYEGAYRKMNDAEAISLCNPQEEQPEGTIPYAETCKAAQTLFEKFKKPLFVTCGSRGSLIITEKGITDIWGIMIMSKVDTVGAGDSYLASVAATMAAGYDMETAAQIGTMVAGVTVQKLFQTGTATPEEIMQIGQDPNYIFSPELAENIRQAEYLENTGIEIVNNWIGDIQIGHAIFDHDGTISTLREGWELIMKPMMIKAVLGHKYKEADELLFQKVQNRVCDYIDKTTGIQTLVQMKGLLNIIREFGFVPENEMLDEFGYKEIYNKELLKMVKVRKEKYRKGELSLEDFTMKNAVPFLQKLYDAGIKLYLASGTDEEDVKKEAEALGYAHLFEGRIYGSVGDISKEAKKIVLDRILSSIGELSFGKLITFGDGPVEMRETRKRGGMSVGIASDELKRFGLNASKRTRLIKSGADVIIPDFSQMNQLLELMKVDK